MAPPPQHVENLGVAFALPCTLSSIQWLAPQNPHETSQWPSWWRNEIPSIGRFDSGLRAIGDSFCLSDRSRSWRCCCANCIFKSCCCGSWRCRFWRVHCANSRLVNRMADGSWPRSWRPRCTNCLIAMCISDSVFRCWQPSYLDQEQKPRNEYAIGGHICRVTCHMKWDHWTIAIKLRNKKRVHKSEWRRCATKLNMTGHQTVRAQRHPSITSGVIWKVENGSFYDKVAGAERHSFKVSWQYGGRWRLRKGQSEWEGQKRRKGEWGRQNGGRLLGLRTMRNAIALKYFVSSIRLPGLRRNPQL